MALQKIARVRSIAICLRSNYCRGTSRDLALFLLLRGGMSIAKLVPRGPRSAERGPVAGHVTGHPRLCGDVRGSVLLCGRTMSSSCFTRALPGAYR